VGFTRTLVAARARSASTAVGGSILLQLIYGAATPGPSTDRLLDGPTNDMWIDPWLAYLRKLGVDYRLNSPVTHVHCADGLIQKVDVDSAEGPLSVEGDYFLFAVPIEVMAKFLESSDILKLDQSLETLIELSDDVAWMNGMQLYLNREIDLDYGHTMYVDSPWALTSVSQIQFWPDFDLSEYGDGKVKGILSIDISNWDANLWKFWNRASNIGLPDHFSIEQTKRLNLRNQATVFTAILTIGYFGLFVLTGLYLPAVIMAIAFAGYMFVLYLNHRGLLRQATVVLLINGYFQIASVAFLLGREPWIQLFMIAAALSPFLYYSMADIKMIVVFVGLGLGVYFLLEVSYAVSQPLIPLGPSVSKIVSIATYTSNFMAVIFFTYYLYFANYSVESKLRDERARSDSLLLNVLPAVIAERMKRGESSIADYYDNVTMLFADVVGFTPLSEKLSPEEAVDLLGEVFTYFDALVEKYEIEKIRTIGDGYYVAAGVPSERSDHAAVVAAMALEMAGFASEVDIPLADQLQIRIGINSGPVVAGVIGIKKFQYDLWGDAVNIASRMESHGVPGRIQITSATYDLIKDQFTCEPRGSIEVKGKGEMETWFLEGEEGHL